LIELVYALERAGELLDDPDAMSGDIRIIRQREAPGQGVGVIEAPRRRCSMTTVPMRMALLNPGNTHRGRGTTTGHAHGGGCCEVLRRRNS